MRTLRFQLVTSWAAMIAGIAAILLPFTHSTSPRAATFDGDLWHVAIPFYLALPIGVVSLRIARSGLVSPRLRIAAWMTAGAGAAITAHFIVWLAVTDTPSILTGWLALSAAGSVLAIGAVRARGWVHRASGVAPIAAMQFAYLANACFCLVFFAGVWQSGAWCTAATALIYGVQIALHATGRTRQQPLGSRPSRG